MVGSSLKDDLVEVIRESQSISIEELAERFSDRWSHPMEVLTLLRELKDGGLISVVETQDFVMLLIKRAA